MVDYYLTYHRQSEVIKRKGTGGEEKQICCNAGKEVIQRGKGGAGVGKIRAGMA